MNTTLMPETLTVAEIQQKTRLGRIHIQRLIRNGILPNLGTSKRFIVSQAALTRFLEQAGKEVQ
jgi:hypothetical protein